MHTDICAAEHRAITFSYRSEGERERWREEETWHQANFLPLAFRRICCINNIREEEGRPFSEKWVSGCKPSSFWDDLQHLPPTPPVQGPSTPGHRSCHLQANAARSPYRNLSFGGLKKWHSQFFWISWPPHPYPHLELIFISPRAKRGDWGSKKSHSRGDSIVSQGLKGI